MRILEDRRAAKARSGKLGSQVSSVAGSGSVDLSFGVGRSRLLRVGLLTLIALGSTLLKAQVVYVTNTHSSTVSVINGTAAVATVPVEAQPIDVAFTPDGNRAYVTHNGSNVVDVIDTTANPPTVVAAFKVSGVGSCGLAFTPDGHYAYVENCDSDSISVVDTRTNPPTLVTDVLVGFFPYYLAFSPNGARAYVTNRNGSLSVIDTTTSPPSVVNTVALGGAPWGIAISADGSRAYVTNRSSNLSIIDTTTSPESVIARVTVGGDAIGVALSPDGSRAYVVNSGSNNVSVVDTKSTPPSVMTTVPVGYRPYGIVVTPDGTRAYVTDADSDAVSIIDLTSNAPSVVATVAVGPMPYGIAIAPSRSATLAITQISPTRGGNSGSVTMQIIGTGLQSGATVKLSGSGADIAGGNTTLPSPSTLITTFDLTGAAPGVRDVVVANPDNTTTTLTGKFIVEQGGAPQVSVDIIGRNKIRAGTAQAYYLAIANRGSIDSSAGIFSLNVPPFITYEQGNGADVSVAGSISDQAFQVANAPDGTTNQSLLFATQSVPAGATQIATIRLTLPPGESSSTFAIAGVWQQDLANMTLQEYLGLINIPFIGYSPGGCIPCLNKYAAELLAYSDVSDSYLKLQTALDKLNLALVNIPVAIAKTSAAALLVTSLGLPAVGGVALTALIDQAESCTQHFFGLQSGQDCLSDLKPILESVVKDALLESNQLSPPVKLALKSLADSIDILLSAINAAGDVLDAYGAEQAAFGYFQQMLGPYRLARDAYLRCLSPAVCQPPLPPPAPNPPGAIMPITGVQSLDPNDKVGALGSGSARYVSGAAELPYAVYFENRSDASAPASSVTITDTLDSGLDLGTLTLGPISFLKQTVTPPSIPLSVAPFRSRADLRPATNLLVDVRGDLNVSTGVLSWTFQSIDPGTNQAPTDPLAGFLPPGAEGSVFFTVKPKSSVTTGTVIQNTATIVFDANPPIDTPTWSHTIDSTKPTSQVNALGATQTATDFSVSWSGADVGSGIQDYTIYVSDNDGPYAGWLTNTPATQATYTGVVGHTYGFYSIARDAVGNVESSKTTAEATTSIVLDSTPPVITPSIAGTLGANGWYTSTVVVTWSVTDPETGVAASSGCTPTALANDTPATIVTCSATNGAGLPNSVSVTIKIDRTPPVITVPAGLTVYAPSAAGAAVTYTVIVADSMDTRPTISCAPASGSTFAVGATTVNCAATDAAGNRSTNTFGVTVVGPDNLLLGQVASPLVQTGKNLSYLIGVANLGPSTAYQVTVSDQLPPGTQFVSASWSGGQCSVGSGITCPTPSHGTPCVWAGGTVTCSLGTLAALSRTNLSGAGVLMVVRVTAPAGTTIKNTAKVTAANVDTNVSNNASTVATKVLK